MRELTFGYDNEEHDCLTWSEYWERRGETPPRREFAAAYPGLLCKRQSGPGALSCGGQSEIRKSSRYYLAGDNAHDVSDAPYGGHVRPPCCS
jgi:hypothetical protein